MFYELGFVFGVSFLYLATVLLCTFEFLLYEFHRFKCMFHVQVYAQVYVQVYFQVYV